MPSSSLVDVEVEVEVEVGVEQGCIKLVSLVSRIPDKLLTVRQMTDFLA